MITGIYKLTFPSGMFYIGKSNDIKNRWRQHYDNLVKGKGSSRMQAEFNRYKDYTQEVLLECHHDHIDIMETYFINYSNKGMMLNTIFAQPLPPEQYDPILQNMGLLRYSTSQHVKALAEQTVTIKNLQAELARERAKPAIVIKEYGDSTVYVQELQAEIDELEIENEYLLSRLQLIKGDVKKSSWFKRIFG